MAGNESLVWLPRKAIYLRNDIRLLGQHMQVPIEVPEDFSVILEKGKGSGVRVRQPADGREGEDCRARKESRGD